MELGTEPGAAATGSDTLPRADLSCPTELEAGSRRYCSGFCTEQVADEDVRGPIIR